MTPFDVLGIDPAADTGQIKAAYRSRARHVHPDRGGDNDAFARLGIAYEEALKLRRDGTDAATDGATPPAGSSTPPIVDWRLLLAEVPGASAGSELAVRVMLGVQVVLLVIGAIISWSGGKPASFGATVASLLAGLVIGAALRLLQLVVAQMGRPEQPAEQPPGE